MAQSLKDRAGALGLPVVINPSVVRTHKQCGISSMTVLNERSVLVTGAAGFIGFHVSKRLLDERVAGGRVDLVTPYYDVTLKERRIAELCKIPKFAFEKLNIADRDRTAALFAERRFPYRHSPRGASRRSPFDA